MTLDLTSPLGRMCVLDLETEPDRTAFTYLRRMPSERENTLFAITSASILEAREDESGWKVSSIASCTPLAQTSAAIDKEEEVLEFVDHHLGDLDAHDGILVTFNGARYDVPLLKRRAARHLRFDLEALLRPSRSHLDLMHAATRPQPSSWPKLEHAAAGLGIPAGYRSLPATKLKSSESWKGQIDVVTTYLLAMYELAIRRSSELPVLLGWAALADRIDLMGAEADHLQLYSRHDMATAGRELIALTKTLAAEADSPGSN